MPPVAAAIAAVSTFLATAAVTVGGASLLSAAVIYSVTSFALKALVVMAATAALTMLTRKPKNQAGNINQGAELKLKLDSSMPRQIIVGTNATGGSVVWSHTHTPAGSKVPNECLKRVIAISDYPSHSLLKIKKGTEDLTFDGPLSHGNRVACTSHFLSKSGSPRCHVTFYNGSQTAADPTMLAGAPGLWTANHIGYGITYAVVEHMYDPDAYTAGEPEFSWIVKGAACYDDRKDGSKPGRSGSHRLNNPATWEWTDNAAIIAAQCLRGWRNPHNTNVLIFGVQAEERDLDDAMLLSAYNTCDQLTDRADGSTEKRYRANINLNCSEAHASILQDLQAAMDGRIIDRGGAITIRPGATHTPILDMTDEDIVWTEQKSWQPRASMEDLTNFITGSFVDGEGDTYSEKPFPTLSNPAWEVDDGGERFITQVALRAVHSWGQVQRITKRMHLATRQQATVAFVAPIWAIEMEQADWFTLTSERWGFVDKYFEVQMMHITQDLKVAIIGRETDPDNEVWEPASDEKPRRDTTWNPTTPDVPIPIFVLTPSSLASGDGTTKVPAIIFYQEDSIQSQETTSIEVQVCLATDTGSGPWSFMPLFPATEGSMLLPGVYMQDTDYAVRARNLGNGRTSDWSPWEYVTTDPDFFTDLVGGLGDLATQDQVDWATQVTGVSKPENDATASRVYRQNATPSSPGINDIWVKLNGGGVPIEVYAWNGSTWIKGADITGLNVASGIVGQGSLATLSQVTWATHVTGTGKPDDFANKVTIYRQSSAPGSPSVNDIWCQLDGLGNAVSLWVYNGSVWINGADRTVYNTAMGITGQGAWATAVVPSGLTPTQVNGRTQYFSSSSGQLYDYRGVLFGYSIDGVAGRTTQPLTSTSTSISVVSHNVTFPSVPSGGTATLSIPSTSFSGLSNDMTYSVFYIPGVGAWSCQGPATTPPYYSSPDGWLFVGSIRTQTGGGTYNPPPYGGGSIDYCVQAKAYLSDTLQAKDAVPGDELFMMRQAGDSCYIGYITKVSHGEAALLRLRTALSSELTVSDTAPLMVKKHHRDSPWAIKASEVRPGMLLPHLVSGEVIWEALLDVTLLGTGPVVRISAGDGIFAATDDPIKIPIFTHNGYNKP